jgi:hypothetical protein
MISSSSLIESRLNSSTNRSDPDTESKVRSSIRAINETIQSNANEPSLAFYRIQVNKTNHFILLRKIFFLGTCTKNFTNNGTKTN